MKKVYINLKLCIYARQCTFSVSKLTRERFGHIIFTGGKKMEGLPSSPYWNPMKNLCSVVKVKLYQGDKQYNSNEDL